MSEGDLSRRDSPKEGPVAKPMLHHLAADGGWDLVKLDLACNSQL
jgi:hypothetical protein